MDLGIAGKVAIVAGGSRGCGRGISEALAAEGVRVVLSGRQAEPVGTTVDAICSAGQTAHGVVADMTLADGVTAILAAAREKYGDPDILVVNAPAPFPSESGKLRGFENCADEDYVTAFENFVLSQGNYPRPILAL